MAPGGPGLQTRELVTDNLSRLSIPCFWRSPTDYLDSLVRPDAAPLTVHGLRILLDVDHEHLRLETQATLGQDVHY